MRALLIACLLAASACHAQDIQVRASVDQEVVGVGESLTFTVEIQCGSNQRAGTPPAPQIPGVTVVSTASSENISIYGSQVNRTRTVQYGLMPQKEGTFTIPPVSVEANGRTYESSPVTFKAVASGAQAQRRPARPDPDDPDAEPEPAQPESLQGLSLRARVTKKEVYQGEPLVYTSVLSSQYPLMSGTGVKEDGQFPGFTVENQQTDRHVRTVQEGGAMYQRAEISRRVLVPTKPGALTIKPEIVQAALRVRRRRAVDPFDPWGGGGFDDPFDIFQRPQMRLVTAQPIEIKVLPLPEQGKPADFTGAVGTDFIVTSMHDKEQLKENEVITLKVTVRGKGDVRPIGEPKLDVGNEFKLFPAKATPKLDVTAEGLTGSKVFEIVLAPRGTGEKTIPGVTFSYFDTTQKKYVTKRTAPVKVTVHPGEREEVIVSTGPAPSQREEVKVVGTDIQYIKEDPSGLASSPELVRSSLFWAANVAPLALLALVWGWQLRRQRMESDVAWARRSKAYKAARRGLAELRAAAAAEPRVFYARLEQVLLEFVAGKLNRAAAGLVVDEVPGVLAAASVEERLAHRVEDQLRKCEEMRYSPASAADAAARQADLETAEQLLAELEGVLS